MATAEVHTQADLDAYLSQHPDGEVVLLGTGPYIIREGQPRIVARGSSQPHIVARESSQPHIEARGSSQPRIVAWESSQPRIVAWGYAQVSVRGPVHGTAQPTNAVLISGGAQILGGQQTVIDPITSPSAWCNYYGVAVVDGVATLYKAVRGNYQSAHGASYAPGTSPVAPDWDGGAAECGGGFHFSPHPAMAREFDHEATRYVACPVALVDMRPPKERDEYPHKIKAHRVCGPIVEVDRDGVPVTTGAA